MSRRPLVYYNDPKLRRPCPPVEKITPAIEALIDDLVDTLYHHDGAGLAAPQIGIHLRLFISRFPHDAPSPDVPPLATPQVYINPELSKPGAATQTAEEGCLSIPAIYGPVTRPLSITVNALDRAGNPLCQQAKSYGARILMHENDHLNGVLYIDRAPRAWRRQHASQLEHLATHPPSP